jgi:uracil-DNA glycosylase
LNGLAEPLAAVLDRAPADWSPVIERWRASPDGQRLIAFVEARRQAGATIYPAAVLHALERTPRASVRVVILGQDPYHGPGQAEGLSFSVPAGVALPPSLRNMLQELSRDLGIERRASGHLGGWADQGVLMLNTTLTVEDAQPASHAKRGWEALTDALVEAVASDPAPKVFMLWGAHAQAKAQLVEAAGAGRHCILKANHPSPLSARRPPVPFLGCGHFGQARDFLAARRPETPPLDWSR